MMSWCNVLKAVKEMGGYGVCQVIWSDDTAEFMFKNLNEDLREHVDTMLMYDWEVIGNVHARSAA